MNRITIDLLPYKNNGPAWDCVFAAGQWMQEKFGGRIDPLSSYRLPYHTSTTYVGDEVYEPRTFMEAKKEACRRSTSAIMEKDFANENWSMLVQFIVDARLGWQLRKEYHHLIISFVDDVTAVEFKLTRPWENKPIAYF